ncbi:MAG TPA: M67 family metallopeptidase [Egibacteraceae bacterium]|nr:M67 family metallopeptidase [Egibacteraceae bacterium]
MTKAAIEGTVDLSRQVYDQMVAHARSDFPYEVCGMVAGTGGRFDRHYEIPNAERSMTFYKMDGKAHLKAITEIEDNDWEFGIYHSHTHTEAFPSVTDVELAVYPEAVYLIVSLQDPEPVIRAFDIRDGRITERVLTVDGEQAPAGNR